jgi:endoglucanase
MDFLCILNGKIVNEQNKPIHLHGVNIGGWMNMENFINGYSGSESHLRALMAEELGQEKAAFFFERMLDYFLGEDDIRFLSEKGVNVLRLPLNYRHFESDGAPFEYMEKGFKRLDAMLDLCEKYNIYVLLDLHSVQGWQNGDWHCDNSTRHATFWQQKQFQDRFYALWKVIAARYKNRAVVAAYNLINEPLSNAPFGRFCRDDQYTADWHTFNRIYRQAVETIRTVDDRHMIMLEGDYYSVLFDQIEQPIDPNVFFSSHNYIGVCTSQLQEYPLEMDGAFWNGELILKQFKETQAYQKTQAYNLPLLVGEFGFNNRHATGISGKQLLAFADQIDAYTRSAAHWTFWTYKDVGSMGWIQLNPESAYAQAIAPLLEAKDALRTDFGWLGGFPPDVAEHIDALSSKIGGYLPWVDTDVNQRYFAQAAMSTYTADQLQWIFVKAFAGKTETQLDEILLSLRFNQCIHNNELDQILESRLKTAGETN